MTRRLGFIRGAIPAQRASKLGRSFHQLTNHARRIALYGTLVENRRRTLTIAGSSAIVITVSTGMNGVVDVRIADHEQVVLGRSFDGHGGESGWQ